MTDCALSGKCIDTSLYCTRLGMRPARVPELSFVHHAGIVLENATSFVLENAGWRTGPDWGRKLGCAGVELAE